MAAIVPSEVRVAAKRGFIRTGAQSLASMIPTSTVAIVLSGEWLLGLGLGAGSAVLTAGLAGAASYLSILSAGIPEDYVSGAVAQLDDQAAVSEARHRDSVDGGSDIA